MSSSTVFPRVTTNAVTIEATAATARVARTGVRRSGFCLSTNLPSSELMTSHQRTPAPIATFPPVGTAAIARNAPPGITTSAPTTARIFSPSGVLCSISAQCC